MRTLRVHRIRCWRERLRLTAYIGPGLSHCAGGIRRRHTCVRVESCQTSALRAASLQSNMSNSTMRAFLSRSSLTVLIAFALTSGAVAGDATCRLSGSAHDPGYGRQSVVRRVGVATLGCRNTSPSLISDVARGQLRRHLVFGITACARHGRMGWASGLDRRGTSLVTTVHLAARGARAPDRNHHLAVVAESCRPGRDRICNGTGDSQCRPARALSLAAALYGAARFRDHPSRH